MQEQGASVCRVPHRTAESANPAWFAGKLFAARHAKPNCTGMQHREHGARRIAPARGATPTEQRAAAAAASSLASRSYSGRAVHVTSYTGGVLYAVHGTLGANGHAAVWRMHDEACATRYCDTASSSLMLQTSISLMARPLH
jgi:hypothetical protein